MSDDNIDNEQITKVPDAKTTSKIKDPKKVAAGKKIKKAKDALAREMKREADPEDKWLPELSLTTVLTVVGNGLTAADLFFRFYTSKTPVTPVHMVHVPSEPAPHRSLDKDRGVFCGGPRIGMV